MNVLTAGAAFYISAALIAVTCVAFMFIQGRTEKLQQKFYLAMMFILLFNAATETVVELVAPVRTENAAYVVILSACKYVYFVSHTAMLPLLGVYVMSITGSLRRFGKRKYWLFITPFLLIELLMVSNPLHHWGYFYDGVNAAYNRNWGVTALYIISAFYILFFVMSLFHSWRAITRPRRVALSYFMIMVITGIVLQLIFIELRVELLADSLAFLGVLLTVEDEGDLIDTAAGFYNRKALRIDLDILLANRMTFHVICVKVENADVINRITGSANTDILSSLLADELVKLAPRYNIYRTSPDTFVLTLLSGDAAYATQAAQSLRTRLDQSWECQHTDVLLNAAVMLAQVPDDIDNTEDLFAMADGALPLVHAPLLAGREDLSYILRRRGVESAIQRGLTEDRFTVYYQPTYTADGLHIHGAEALVRLQDDKLGLLMPDEFIPVAEQIGLIGEVDDYVLRTVCRLMAGGQPQSRGIASVNVNLSVLQLFAPGFVEHILAIVDESGADASCINFEITESVDSHDYAAVEAVVDQLREHGFRIYMDDYGTGYSNVRSLFSMAFDVVKIDKSLLWGAEESELGSIILENNVRMLRQMGRGILVEGVETPAQIDLLQKLGVDYLQGFYFSRPVPEDRLLQLPPVVDQPDRRRQRVHIPIKR